MLFTYFILPRQKTDREHLVKKNVAIGYETVSTPGRSLPLLAP